MSLTNTLPVLLAELVALIAYAGIPHRQVNAVSCSTDVRVHSTFIDFFKINKCGGDNRYKHKDFTATCKPFVFPD